MKILIATSNGQGQRANDFCHTTENEWVKFGATCDRDIANPDGGCGCGRAMIGVVSGKATTTFAVADLPITREEYLAAMRKADEAWLKYIPDHEVEAMVQEDTTELIRIASLFPVGAVLEKRLDEIRVRRVLPLKKATPQAMLLPFAR